MDYEQGLEQLKQRARGTDWFQECALYEGRLRDNLNEERRYGRTELTRSNRAQIIEQLNNLADKHLKVSFVDLCIHENSDQHKKAVYQSIASPEQSHLDVLTQTTAVPLPISENISPSSSPLVFVSSSNRDRNFLEELRVHLAPYIRTNKVVCWDDAKIDPGTVWQEEIKASMQAANTAVLLISAHFLASDFIVNYELPYLLASAKSGKLMILSVIIRPCLFKDIDLAQLQTINAPSQPLSAMSKSDRDKVWVKVVESIKRNL